MRHLARGELVTTPEKAAVVTRILEEIYISAKTGKPYYFEKMFRIALLSRWHVHAHKNDQRYAKEFLEQPDCKVTCVWDRDPVIAKEWGEEYGVPYETDLEKVLSREDVDGVLVTSNTAEHCELFIAAAEHKKHIFTEKVLAYNLEEAYKIKEAIDRNGVSQFFFQ